MRCEDDQPGGGEAKGNIEAEGGSTDGGARRVVERYGVEETPDGDLLLATVTGDHQWLIEALASGADVNAVDRRYGWPMLYWAAQKKMMSMSVVVLLGAGADPHARGFDGETPLHAAARWGELASIAVLVKGG
ncbi:MAG: ankyrin repeat domain-containing protein, partial [Acidobacteriota bacterium]|nr:ankyrin repeat domain-containing protein [Acidobacteriota bacterium]